MSLDNVFGQVSKASASMYRILSSGFSKLDASQLIEFQKAVGISAKVIRADLYNTADVMTTIANAYQLNIDEIKKLQDWFYLTVREGKAQGQDLARTLGLVINSASEAGVSLNELGAAIAVLSRTQSVSQSMIGLNQMLNAFIKPTLQAQAAARKWGIELNATALQTRGLTSFLTELHEKVGGNVEALEAMFGNIRAGRAILSLTGKQFQNYLNVLNTYNTEQGGGAEAFAKQIDTLENAYERLQAQ
jgi:TP901 family phage tail tape measure protein